MSSAQIDFIKASNSEAHAGVGANAWTARTKNAPALFLTAFILTRFLHDLLCCISKTTASHWWLTYLSAGSSNGDVAQSLVLKMDESTKVLGQVSAKLRSKQNWV